MLVERTDKQITIKISADVDSFSIQRLIDYAKYLEATSQSKVKQLEVDKLSDELNNDWWEKNRNRFV
jgi:hypothetical protein